MSKNVSKFGWWLRFWDRTFCRLQHGRNCPHIPGIGVFWERVFM